MPPEIEDAFVQQQLGTLIGLYQHHLDIFLNCSLSLLAWNKDDFDDGFCHSYFRCGKHSLFIYWRF